jgi:hypothetical protein
MSWLVLSVQLLRPLFDCYTLAGNICRSPLGEAVMRHVAKERGLDILVDSAGTAGYHVGEDPDERSFQTVWFLESSENNPNVVRTVQTCKKVYRICCEPIIVILPLTSNKSMECRSLARLDKSLLRISQSLHTSLRQMSRISTLWSGWSRRIQRLKWSSLGPMWITNLSWWVEQHFLLPFFVWALKVF